MVALSKRFAFRVRFGSIDILNLRVRGHDTQTYLQTLAKVRQVLQHCKIDLTSGAVHQKQQNVGASDTRHNLLPLPHRNLRTTTIRSSGVHLLSRWLHPLDFGDEEMSDGKVVCQNEGCYQTFRLGSECPLCWMRDD